MGTITGLRQAPPVRPARNGNGRPFPPPGGKKFWIDLDNTPHVPFFAPIIEELKRRGHSVVITARSAFQVCELADLMGLDYAAVGRHYGKKRLAKACGMCIRAMQLSPFALRERPHLAVSHGSRSQLLAAFALRVPSLLIDDYEFSQSFGSLTWVMVPEVIARSDARFARARVLTYPGIKEDVYVPRFEPDPGLRAELGLRASDLVVTVRPPATEAHYHCPASDELFSALMTVLGEHRDVKIVLLPRNSAQSARLRSAWRRLFQEGRIVVPERAVDGLNLIWHSDLVVSGGGTMNREAAALGVPVYSTFRGPIGAVDRCLAGEGRLTLLETVEDVRTKIVLKRRNRSTPPPAGNGEVLGAVVGHIIAIAAGAGSAVSSGERASGSGI